MNERLAQAGTQMREALEKVRNAWKELEASRRKLIIAIAIGVLAIIIALVVFLNVRSNRYTVLYDGLSQEDIYQSIAVLQTAGIPARVNDDGQLEVPNKQIEVAMGQLALEGIPATTLDYNVLADASGLTTTEFEKRQALINQWQNRLQDTIKSFDGVQNAIVTLNIEDNSNRVWDSQASKSSGSATVIMKSGHVLSLQQAQAIRLLIGPSVGIDPKEVTVMDGEMNVLAAAGEEYDVNAAVTSQFLERMGLQTELENDLVNKAANLLSLRYPSPDDWRVSCTVRLDFDAAVQEIKTYIPLEGTIHGVLDEEEVQAEMGTGQFAEGVVGETDNTDVPIYVDQDGDGVMDTVDYYRFRDYAISYILEQIERDGPVIQSASISVVVNDSLSNESRQTLRQAVAQGTGIDIENVSVESMLLPTDTGQPELTDDVTGGWLGIPLLYWLIVLGVLVVLIIVLVIIMVLRARKKKRLLAEELAAAEAEAAEAERIQAEIEERKKQLKEAALGDESENAITNEVREFARNNPEITANLLRNWLKEGE